MVTLGTGCHRNYCCKYRNLCRHFHVREALVMAERQSHDIKPGTSTASGKQACSLHSYLIYISTESECQLVNHVECVMDLSPSKICQMYLARRGFLAIDVTACFVASTKCNSSRIPGTVLLVSNIDRIPSQIDWKQLCILIECIDLPCRRSDRYLSTYGGVWL